MKIYLDVLIITNIFVTYFLLQSTRMIVHRTVNSKRIVLGAVFGGACSLAILITVPPVVLAVGKLLISVLICAISFGFTSVKLLIKNTIVFYIVSFLYAGFMFALWYFVTPLGMQYRNGIAYFNVSAVVLVLSTVLAYLVIRFIQFWLHKIPDEHQRFQVEIDCAGKSVLLSGFLDTGNHLQDIVSGNPVWICELKSLSGLLPYEVYDAVEQEQIETIETLSWKKRLRLVPIHAVTGTGMLICFKPDRVLVYLDQQSPVEKQVMIGITSEKLSDGEFSIIVNEI